MDDLLNLVSKWSPIIAPLLWVAWFVHILDKRIAIIEANHDSFERKLEKIYLKLMEIKNNDD